ncbi:hypothetical protein Dimus_032905 [Dionaea muscipula]
MRSVYHPYSSMPPTPSYTPPPPPAAAAYNTLLALCILVVVALVIIAVLLFLCFVCILFWRLFRSIFCPPPPQPAADSNTPSARRRLLRKLVCIDVILVPISLFLGFLGSMNIPSSNTPPPPPPAAADCNTSPARIWILVFLLIGVAIVFFVRLFASRRRYSSSVLLRYPLWAAYLSIIPIVSYTFGMIRQLPAVTRSPLYPIWGLIILALAYGLISNISFTLDDNENPLRKLLEFSVLTFYAISLLLNRGTLSALYDLYSVIIVSREITMLIDQADYVYVYASLSPSKGIAGTFAAKIASYMGMEHELTDGAGAEINPSCMIGYKYLVGLRDANPRSSSPNFENWEDIVTVEQIWGCQGTLLHSGGDAEEDGRRKDICLSFAFFWLLLRRYGGHPLHESSHEKTWLLFGDGLLLLPERAFRVIEVELHFLYDFFYTKYFLTYTGGPLLTVLRISLCSYYIGFATAALLGYDPMLDNGIVVIDGKVFDVHVTWILASALVLFEIIDTVAEATSIWAKVGLICHYVKNNGSTGADWKIVKWMTEVIIGRTHWRMRIPWERKLGQYSFLDSYDHVPWLKDFYLGNIIDWPRDGQNEGERIKLSEQVKRAVVKSIKRNHDRLSNGANSLARNRFDQERLLQECNFEFESTAVSEYILVWHMATRLCERLAPPSPPSNIKPAPAAEAAVDEDFHVATSLSKYCAYLVAFAPELLPDHQNTAQRIFDRMVSDAKVLLEGSHSATDTFNKMRGDPANGSPFKAAATLAMELLAEHGMADRWKILAGFWAELMVYLAPSDNAKAHAEHLATGGEFITHLWALLTHAGIITRPN